MCLEETRSSHVGFALPIHLGAGACTAAPLSNGLPDSQSEAFQRAPALLRVPFPLGGWEKGPLFCKCL